MPETKDHKAIGLVLALVLALLVSACSLDTLPRAAATSIAQERTPVPLPVTPTTTTAPLPRPTGSATPAPTATRAAPAVVLPPTVVNCPVRADRLA